MATPVLETERLILRPLRMDDAPAIQRWFDNWNIIQYVGSEVPWPYPADGAETFLRDVALPSVASGESLLWAITVLGDDQLIGVMDFAFVAGDVGNRGFWLAEHLWGRGYMTEAVVAMQDYVLLELGVERMIVVNAATNLASRRIKEKTGARLLGQIELSHRDGERLYDQWEVTRQDWTRLRAG